MIPQTLKTKPDLINDLFPVIPVLGWGTGIDILIDMISFACHLYLVCHEKPELMLRVRFTTSLCVESSAEKSFGTMPIATPL